MICPIRLLDLRYIATREIKINVVLFGIFATFILYLSQNKNPYDYDRLYFTKIYGYCGSLPFSCVLIIEVSSGTFLY